MKNFDSRSDPRWPKNIYSTEQTYEKPKQHVWVYQVGLLKITFLNFYVVAARLKMGKPKKGKKEVEVTEAR